jgi:hypothetical protein
VQLIGEYFITAAGVAASNEIFATAMLNAKTVNAPFLFFYLCPLFRYIGKSLVAWETRKYKRFRRNKMMAVYFIN